MTLKKCIQCDKLTEPENKLCFDCNTVEHRDQTTRDILEIIGKRLKLKIDLIKYWDLEDEVYERIAKHEGSKPVTRVKELELKALSNMTGEDVVNSLTYDEGKEYSKEMEWDD